MSNCKEFLAQVLNIMGEYFEKHAFKFLHSYEDGKFDHCSLVFMSDKCSLKFLRDRDNVIIKLGPVCTDRNYNGGTDSDWFSIGTVLVLLREVDECLEDAAHPTEQVESSAGNMHPKTRVEGELEKYRDLFLALGDKLFSIFETSRFEMYKTRLRTLSKPRRNMPE